MEEKKKEQLIKIDFPDYSLITEDVREKTKVNSSHFRGGVRLLTGRFWTEKEYNERRKKILNTKLP